MLEGSGTGVKLALIDITPSYAVVPLVMFTNDRKMMGDFVNRPWLRSLAWLVTGVIIVLNVKLLYDFVAGS